MASRTTFLSPVFSHPPPPPLPSPSARKVYGAKSKQEWGERACHIATPRHFGGRASAGASVFIMLNNIPRPSGPSLLSFYYISVRDS